MIKRSLIILLCSLFCFTLSSNASTYNQGIVTSGAYVYTSTSASSIVTSDTGGKIKLYSPESVEIIGTSGNYYQIKFLYSGFTYTGYISKSNVTSTVYTIDDDYTQGLIETGFPEDYAVKLSILHAIHPNWTFTPSFTGGTTSGLDFYTAVSEEADPVSKNLISSSNTSLRSTADGAYSNGQWISLSGSGWYAASEQTIAFFMDPRNFLDESHIFMFENLGYNSKTQTSTTVTKIIGSSFMSSYFTCTSSSNSCVVGNHYYTDTFMEVGESLGVSPVHLASRVLQEQGSSGSVLSLGQGYNGEYVGYYNFFNIKASGTTTAEVILNGLEYAYNQKWNNQYFSIYGGAATIANGYISIGQSTLYYQKFNTIYLGSLYSHQYMQNVKAPYSESYSTYTGYYNSYDSANAWNESTYDFLIPIYSNMPTSTSLDASGNSDATLSSLTTSSCKLNPSFSSSIYSYSCYASLDTESVTIEASTTNSLATVSNTGTTTLTSDNQTVKLVVTAANGSAATYTINIIRTEEDGYTPLEILNGIGLKVSGTYVYNISYDSDISNIPSSIANSYYFANVKLTNSSGSTITDGTVKTGDKVTITNSGETATYTIVIYGDTTGDGVIDIRDLLSVQKHILKSKTLSGAYLTSADINKDNTVDIRDLLLVQKYIVGAYSISQG